MQEDVSRPFYDVDVTYLHITVHFSLAIYWPSYICLFIFPRKYHSFSKETILNMHKIKERMRLL